MKLRITDLTRWDGEIDRRGYLIWGTILFSIKFCLDSIVSRWLFDRHWSIVEYFRPTMAPDVSTSRDPLAYLVTLWVISFPFLAAGVILTAKRLRSAGLSVGWVVLFVVPVIKLILFTILLLLPSRHEAPAQGFHSADVKSWLGIFIPGNRFASAALGVGLSVVTLFSLSGSPPPISSVMHGPFLQACPSFSVSYRSLSSAITRSGRCVVASC